MEIVQLIQTGSSNLFILVLTAIILGALHGLEPGHSKTMIAAFIISIRGTVIQAALLGLSATVSHTILVFIVALSGMYFLGGKFYAEATEPYFQLVSGILIIVIAIWMLFRTWKYQYNFNKIHSHHHEADLETVNIVSQKYQDSHEFKHAEGIRRHFTNKEITTGQIILFGFTGGLIPCPASITVLLLCLQLKKIALGLILVLGFSIGLAATMVFTGVVASLSVKHIERRWSGFSKIARYVPYLSGILILVVGLYVSYHVLI